VRVQEEMKEKGGNQNGNKKRRGDQKGTKSTEKRQTKRVEKDIYFSLLMTRWDETA